MARLPVRVAVRIDRLARSAHRFHRYAHHPLCEEYGGEVVRLGRRSRICRGCVLVAMGGLAGLSASFFWRVAWSALVLSWVVAVVGLAYAMVRRRPRRARAPKLVSRFLPSAVIAFTLGSAVQLGTAGCAIAAACAVPLFGIVALYRRRGPDRTPCASCPERNLPTPCRGIAPIVRRERAFRRLAGQWLAGVRL
jgi:hypothetical protein